MKQNNPAPGTERPASTTNRDPLPDMMDCLARRHCDYDGSTQLCWLRFRSAPVGWPLGDVLRRRSCFSGLHLAWKNILYDHIPSSSFGLV